MSWNDGALLYGSRRVDIYSANAGTGGVGNGTTWGTSPKATYILENISVTIATREVSQYDEIGQPSGAFGVLDFKTGSAVAQIPYLVNPTNSAVMELKPSDAFTLKLDGQNQESFVITSVDHPESQLEARKQSFRFRKLVSAAGPALST